MRLTTERLILRELVDDDARAIYEIERDPAVSRYMSGFADSLDSAEEYVAGVITSGVVVPRMVYDFAICAPGDDRMMGRAGMKRGDVEPREAMLWYVLAPVHHGNGFATEAARAVMRFAFEELGVHRIYADVDPRNPSSIRVCERLGMRREAHFVENVFLRDEWCDSFIYAMLRREWQT